jgi:Ca2+-transporting ATPase
VPFCVRSADGAALDPAGVGDWLARADALAAQGLRVLALATRELAAPPDSATPETLERELTLLGLVGLLDPPREGVAEAVGDCLRAGITPIMITGDHPGTARAIAGRVGIGDGDVAVMTGTELSDISQTELERRVDAIRIYARVDPEQKTRIVSALQQRGHYVAMTGDGVNDAPALKCADIGVAMGLQGTDVAREAADMVLLDDDFSTIVSAVREGRRVYDDIRKFIKYTMTSNSGELWTLFLAPFLGLPIPLLPIHILWINLVTDGLPGLALSAEPAEPDIMRRPPRPPGESIFAGGMWQHMLWAGLLIGGLSILAQAAALRAESPHWQTWVFTVLTLCQLVHVLVIRSDAEPIWRTGLRGNPALLGSVVLTVGLQLAVIYVPVLQPIFHTGALSGAEFALCLSLSLVVGVAVEIEKWLIRRGTLYTHRPAGR